MSKAEAPVAAAVQVAAETPRDEDMAPAYEENDEVMEVEDSPAGDTQNVTGAEGDLDMLNSEKCALLRRLLYICGRCRKPKSELDS